MTNNKTESPNKSEPRKLIHFPVIHTQADLGNLKESVKQMMLKKYGLHALRRKEDLVNQHWNAIEHRIETLKLDFNQVRLYQDALPVCGHELDIVKDLAKQGSRNYRLLMRLIEKGATLTGTESSDLLLAEYENIKKEMHTESIDPFLKSGAALKNAEKILSERDRFIARRISRTLLPGEMGIIFLGLLHDFQQYLASDILVIDPFARRMENVFKARGGA